MKRAKLRPTGIEAEARAPRPVRGGRPLVLSLAAAAFSLSLSLTTAAPAYAGEPLVDGETDAALDRFGGQRPAWRLPAPLASLLPTPQVFMPVDGGPWQVYPGYSYRFDGLDPFFMSRWRVSGPLVRAGAESLSVIALNMAIYWLSPGWNAPDWELSWDAKSWREKIVTFQGVLFDTNNFNTNAVSHPIAGALYYTTSRGNNLSIGQSYAVAFAASTFWEYISEYKERVSLNDLIMTPGGGAAIGESFSQMSLFFSRGSHNVVNEILGLLFSPFAKLNQQIDPRLAPRLAPVNGLGLPSDVFHRFDVSIGAGVTAMDDGTQRGEGEIELETEVINLPEYDRRERASRFVSDGSFSKIHARFAFAAGDLYEGTVLTKAALFGHFMQDDGREGARRGAIKSVFVGASTAFDFSLHDWSNVYKDRVAVVNLPGPTLDASIRKGALKLRASLDVNADFASVSTPALDDYIAERGDRGIKSVLASKKYYYAAGVTIRPRLSVEYGRIELVSDTTVDFFHSIQGLDRFQREVTRDFALDDQRVLHGVSLRYRHPYSWSGSVRTPDFGQAPWIRYERATRSGQIGSVQRSLSEERYQIGISLIF